MKHWSISIVIAVLLLFVPGCVRKGPVLVDFSYLVRAGVTPDRPPKAVVGIVPLIDEREKGESVAGRRFNPVGDTVNDFVVQGTVSRQVTEALKTALSIRDFTVRDVSPTERPAEHVDFVLTGSIKSFWVESVSTFPKTKMTARVELRIAAKDPGGDKVLHAVTVRSSLEDTSAGYSTSLVQETLSEALTAAINKVFDEEEFKKLFR